MTRISEQSSEQRIARIFSPILTATALGVLLAGCGQAATPDSDDKDAMMEASSSSSVEAMMESSGDAVMQSSAMNGDAMMQSSAMMSEGAMHMYRDGTFTAGGSYRSPAGDESVQISLTLKGDVVTDATFSGDATHQKSKLMQDAFAAGFKEQVVGKSIGDVSVGVVNGSSLTGAGFMDAVSKIKAEAKA